MPQLFIHIGYPKAASTWLQTQVLTAANGFDAPWKTHGNLAIERLALTNSLRFDPASIRREFEEARSSNSDDLVLSHEALVGDPVRGGYWGFEVAERLAVVFPQARILMFVRNQADYAYSAWSEHLRRGGVFSADDYLQTGDVPAGYRSFCPPSFLLFDELARRYADLFGKENIFVFPIEALSADPERAVKLLGDFLGRPLPETLAEQRVYAGDKGATVRYYRWANRLFSPYDPTQRRKRKLIANFASKLNRRLPQSIHARVRKEDKAKFASAVRGFYPASNRRLQEFTAVDLSALGYEMRERE